VYHLFLGFGLDSTRYTQTGSIKAGTIKNRPHIGKETNKNKKVHSQTKTKIILFRLTETFTPLRWGFFMGKTPFNSALNNKYLYFISIYSNHVSIIVKIMHNTPYINKTRNRILIVKWAFLFNKTKRAPLSRIMTQNNIILSSVR